MPFAPAASPQPCLRQRWTGVPQPPPHPQRESRPRATVLPADAGRAPPEQAAARLLLSLETRLCSSGELGGRGFQMPTCVFPTPVLRSRVDSKTLTRNTRLIAEALTRVIYNLTEKVRCPPRPPAPAPPSPRVGLRAAPSLSTGDPPRHAGLHGADGNGGGRAGRGRQGRRGGGSRDLGAPRSRSSRSSWTR